MIQESSMFLILIYLSPHQDEREEIRQSSYQDFQIIDHQGQEGRFGSRLAYFMPRRNE
jgi:hypothetical protein